MTIGSVDGLISGLSTTDLINQLVAAEAGSQTALKTRADTAQKAVTAMQTINSKLAALATAADALTANRAFNPVSTTSSSSAVTATATSSALAGTLTFDVKNLAAAEAHVSAGAHALTDIVATPPTISITKGGVQVDVALSDGRLETVVAAINAGNAGVRAAAVQVTPGQYKLQLTSTTTGAASDFTVSGFSVPVAEMTPGADATVHVGPALGGYNVTSATNTFSNVLPGVTFTATKAEDGITLDVSLDTAGVTTKVKDMVSAVNAAVDEIKKQAAFSTDATKRGPLASEALFRQLAASLTGTVTQSVSGTSLAKMGIALSKEGAVTFNATKFEEAFKADPVAVGRALGQGSTFTPDVATTGSISTNSIGHRTVPGNHTVVIIQAATQAGASYDIPAVVPGETYSITLNDVTASYVANGTDGIAEVTAGLRAAAATKNLSVSIATNGTSLDVSATAYGSKQLLSLGAAAGASVSSTSGVDVMGTIGGLVATGSGRVLSTAGVTGDATDISLTVSLTQADLAGGGGTGALAVQPGLGQRLETLAKKASDSYDGSVTKAIERRNQAIKGYNDQVSAWDVRLATKRNSLKMQFSNLEVTLGKLKNQSSWLAGQISSL